LAKQGGRIKVVTNDDATEVVLLSPLTCILESDRRIVISMGGQELTTTSKKLGGKKKTQNTRMDKLIKSVDRTKSFWLITTIPPECKRSSMLSAMDTIQIIAEQKEAGLHITLTARGAKGEAFEESVKTFSAEVQKYIESLRPVVAKSAEYPPAFRDVYPAMITVLENIKTEQEPKNCQTNSAFAITVMLRNNTINKFLAPELLVLPFTWDE
jgi:hypothetical protein